VIANAAAVPIRGVTDARPEMAGASRSKIARPAPTRPCAIGSRQIVEAYTARGQRAYVRSREDGAANSRVMQKLDNHDLDVIVQVRKFDEGFDHPFHVPRAGRETKVADPIPAFLKKSLLFIFCLHRNETADTVQESTGNGLPRCVQK
jgi:hypothetical protein